MTNKIKAIFRDTDFNEIINKSAIFLIFKILAFGLAYAFALVIIKYYGTDIYGFVTLSFTILMMTSVLSRFGMDVSLTKMFSIENTAKSATLYLYSMITSFILALSIGALIFFFSEKIAADVFSKPNFEVHLKWTAITIPLWSIVFVNIGVFRGLKKAVSYSALDNFGRFFLGLFLLVFFTSLTDTELYYPLMAHFFGLLILSIVSTYIVWNSLDYRKVLSKIDFKNFFIASIPIMISSSIVIFLAWSDKILLGIYGTERDVAVYDICIRIATLITFNLDALNAILSSKISKYYIEDKIEDLSKVVQFSAKVSTGISLLIFIVLLFFSSEILSFFGEEFVMGKSTLMILVFGQMFNAFCGPVGNLMHMTGHQTEFRNIMACTLLINIALNIILIKKMGINGAALATTISLVFWNLLGVIVIKRKLKIYSFYNPFRVNIG